LPPAISLLISDKEKKDEKSRSSLDQKRPPVASLPGHEKKGEVVQKGPSSVWDWTPVEAGIYRVNVVVKDALGNTVDSGWTPEYKIVPELLFKELSSDRTPPQAALTTIRWTAKATGGIGALIYEFRTLKDKKDKVVQTGTSPDLDWIPIREGMYRIKTVVRDAIGNSVDSGWSPEYKIVPQLQIREFDADRESPQAAVMTTIWWTARATGGVGDHTYDFRILKGTEENVVQTGSSPGWGWRPVETGKYRVKVIVRDTLHNTVDSGWSPEYEIDTFINLYSPIAVMPIANFSKQWAPYSAIRQSLTDLLQEQGLTVLNNEVLESFMERHRIRYTGGMDRATAEAFEKENMARAVLITALEHYDTMYPPKISITTRLVSTRNKPEILWMDSVGLAGHDAPKLLDLGLIKKHRVLFEKAVRNLSGSFQLFLQGKKNIINVERGWLEEPRFEPKIHHRSSAIIEKDRGYTVAVLPFFNLSDRKYAGDIMALHFARELGKFENFNIIEPGVVREALLKFRVIMFDGISLPQTARISSMLNADFILTGNIMDYNDYTGSVGRPDVDFSTLLIERGSREAVWTSKSYNLGDDDVYFFDLGKINTANAMAAEMVRAVAEMMVVK
jgi:TolB-like protein